GARPDLFQRLLDLLLGWAFWLFERAFSLGTAAYTWAVGGLLRVCLVVLVLYAGLLGLTWWGFLQLPTGFIPTQDKGYLLASIQLPDAASTERTRNVMKKIERLVLETKGVRFCTSVGGNSFLLSASGSNFGSMFIIPDPFDMRRGDPDQTGDAILAKLRDKFEKELPEAVVAAFGPPPVSGLGRAGGFRVMIEDRGEVGPEML